MECYNLYFLSRLKDDLLFGRTEQIWSKRSQELVIKNHERRCVEGLVNDLFPLSPSPEFFDGFIFSYTIPHIGKEFDLLKITEHGVLNIELKSSFVGKQNIEDQLRKNKYYLSHLSKPVYACTYVLKTGKYYTLNDQNELVSTSKHEVALALALHAGSYIKHIAPLFKACQYLISPVADPERFISGNYFLTLHQQQAKSRFLSAMERGSLLFAIRGSVGTGKTLLLYDLCKTAAQKGSKCLFLYPGTLKEGHDALNNAIPGFTIRTAQDLKTDELEAYDCIFVDECSLIGKIFFERLLCLQKQGKTVALAYDPDGRIALGDQYVDPDHLLKNEKWVSGINLTNTIRTNTDILYFAAILFDQRQATRAVDADHVRLLYLPEKEADRCADYYANEKYGIFDCRVSRADLQHPPAFSEWDKGIVILDDGYFYSNAGRLLTTKKGAERSVLQNRLKKAVLKVREQMVFVVTDLKLYKELLSLFE